MKENTEKLQLPATATIKQALQNLNESRRQVVFVVDAQKRVIGCVTDGDIRRGLLRGETLESSIEKVSRKDFTSAPKGTSSADVVRVMISMGVRQMPLLDEEGRLAGVRTLDDFIQPTAIAIDFPVVIMAGGRGKRLFPHTETTPKPLLKVGAHSLIERTIKGLQAAGAREFYITVNYLADQIMSHLGDGSRYGCKIQYVQENQPLGTAGSLSLLKGKISEDFLLMNADILSTVDLSLLTQFHKEHKAVATVCAKVHTISIPYGVVRAERSDVLGIDEKPDLSVNVNAGIYFLSPTIIEMLPLNQYLDMPDLLQNLIATGKRVKCFQSTEPWLDVGSHVDLEKAEKNLEYLTR